MRLAFLSIHHQFLRIQPRFLATFVVCIAVLFTSSSPAQVIIDGSLGGNPSAVASGTLPNNQALSNGATVTDHLITHDLGTTIGNNLFHSFTELSVAAGKSATFTGPDTIANILSRVTGSNASQIDGILASTIDNANLFLLNPNGVIFGENATLDINGSFYASNADFIQLEDGGRFYANLDKYTVLTAAAPEAFGFLGETPPTINADSQATMRVESLTVVNGESITLVGRDSMAGEDMVDGIIIRGGTLERPNGQVKLMSIGGEQTPSIEQISVDIDTLEAQEVDAQGGVISTSVQLGSMTIDQGAQIDTSGYGGGTVILRGGKLMIEESKISANVTGSEVGEIGQGIDIEMADEVIITKSSTLETNVTANAASGIGSGGIQVKTNLLETRGDFDIFTFTEFHSDVAKDSKGGGSGDIQINANSLIQELTIFQTSTESTTNSGNILLKVYDSYNMEFSSVQTESKGSGNAGNIELLVKNGPISLTDFSGLTTQSFQKGDAGEIKVLVETGDASFKQFAGIFSRIEGSGVGGNIIVNAKNLELANTASIGVENFSEQQTGGVTISLTGNLNLSESSAIDGVSATSAQGSTIAIAAKNVAITSNSQVTTETQSSGPGGNLNISAENFYLIDDSFITSEAKSSGNAGNINIKLSNTFSTNTGGKVLASTSATGNGGNIAIAADNVNLTTGSTITADSTSMDAGAGKAGNINLTADQTIQISDSTVSTKSVNALGGNIQLNAMDMAQITNSDVTTQVLEGSESAGALDIDPDFVVIQNSNILSTAVSGDGGPITIIANSAVLVDPFSTLDASSQFGGNGTIDIQAPIQQLSEAIAPLPEDIVKAAALYAEACASQKGGQFSSMVKNTDSSISPAPTGFLSSPLTFHIPGLPQPASQQAHLSPVSQLTNVLQDFLAHMTWKIHDPLSAVIPFQPCTSAKG